MNQSHFILSSYLHCNQSYVFYCSSRCSIFIAKIMAAIFDFNGTKQAVDVQK